MSDTSASSKTQFKDKEKEQDVRTSNILAAKAVADLVRTSLGPRGMDKMISDESGEVTITNDGATILDKLNVIHPAAKMMVELSKAQDVEAGDGTTSIVVIAGSLLNCCTKLVKKGVHPTIIAGAFLKASAKAQEILKNMAIPVSLDDKETLAKCAATSMSSKVISQYSGTLAPLAVDAVLKVMDSPDATNIDMNDIKIVNKLGGTIEDTHIVDGLIFTQGAASAAGGPRKIANAKIGLIQFCLSPPKANIDQSVVISDYQQMDRALMEERKYILNLCQKIKKAGCNVLLIQKSILRDAVNDMSLQFLAKMKIMVITDIERNDVEYITKTLGCVPIASIEGFKAEKLGSAKICEELNTSGGKIVQITEIENRGKTISILCRGSNKLLVDECDRSLHDALCVIRSIVKSRFLITGGGSPEVEMSLKLTEYAKSLSGMEQFCVKAYADALEVVPYTLAENAGLNPISIVTELRNKHAAGNPKFGINVRKGTVSDMQVESVVQPLLVSSSIIKLATESVAMILKIDDIVAGR